MTKLITADLHLNRLARDVYRHDFQKELRHLVKKFRVRWVAILGDLTDEKDYHSADLVNKVVSHIYELAQLVEAVIIVKGNHDYTDIVQTPYFAFLSRVDGVIWVGRPTPGLKLENASSTTVEAFSSTIFLPHTPNPESDWDWINFKGYEHAFAHNTFAGARGDNGQKLGGAPISMFPKTIQVISGDVHVPQRIGPVTYVGPPYRIDFGDNFLPRVLLQPSNGEIWQELVDGPRKQLLEITTDTQLNNLIDDHNLAPGDILKVRVELKEGQYAEWGKIKEKIQNWTDKQHYVAHMIQPIHKQVRISKKKIAQQPTKSDNEILKTFAKRQNVDEATLKVGLKLLEKA